MPWTIFSAPGLRIVISGGVARQHAELAVGAVGDDEVDVALEQAALDADDAKRYWHQLPCFFFISSPCARASSMVPTM